MAARIPPVVVTDAPVHENVLTGDAINLSKIPVAKYSPDDGGPYITAEIIVSKNPETGIPDIGHYRFEGHRQADLQLPCAAEPSFRSEHGDGASLRGCLETAMGDLNPDNSMESERSPIPGAFDVDPRDPGRA